MWQSFLSPIPKLWLRTFASLARKKQATVEKVVNVSADRGFYDHFIIYAKSGDINLKEVLSYELSTVPSSFVHSDGSLRKKVQTFAAVWDGKDRECSTGIASWRLSFHSRWMAFVHMLKAGGASTFGALAESDYDLMTASFGQNGWKPVDVVSEQYGISQKNQESMRSL